MRSRAAAEAAVAEVHAEQVGVRFAAEIERQQGSRSSPELSCGQIARAAPAVHGRGGDAGRCRNLSVRETCGREPEDSLLVDMRTHVRMIASGSDGLAG
jgi:hypothetical protein